MNFFFRKILAISILLLIPVLLSASGKNIVVVIDPGHGGRDIGAVYKNIKEKDIVLKIGLKLGEYINNYLPDVKVIYTRNSDTFVTLHQRANLANKNKADLFISLHANFCKEPYIAGTETFILGLHRSLENLEVAKKENAVILFEEDYSEHYEGFDPNLSESYIMFELIQDEFLEQSADFANQVQNQFRERADRKDRGVKQAGFLVLRQTGMPSVLIETGFLSNPYEAKFLNSEKGQAYIASAIFRAFRNYIKTIMAKSEFNIVETPNNKPDETLPAEQDKANTETDIYFSLQLAASRRNVKPVPSNFKRLENVRKIESGNIFKYFYGKEKKHEDIEKLRTQIKKKYPDSFVVAFKNNKQISIDEALKCINED